MNSAKGGKTVLIYKNISTDINGNIRQNINFLILLCIFKALNSLCIYEMWKMDSIR